jgi:hypothetical protein
MHLVRTGRTATEVVEQHDNKRCPCGALLVHPHVLVSYRTCECFPGEKGHRTRTCRECGRIDYDPPHDPDAS